MKLFAAFVLLIAGISALPQEVIPRGSVTDRIVRSIENFKDRVRDNGYDPLHIKRESGYFALPVPVIFTAAGFCEDIMSTGLSNIVINDIDYDGSRLTIDLEMPHVHFSAGIAVGELVIFGHKVTGEGSGSLDLRNIRVKGAVQISHAGGISASDVDVDTSLGGIVADLNLTIMSYDLGEYLNGFLNVVVPNYLENFKAELDELIGYYLKRYINNNILD